MSSSSSTPSVPIVRCSCGISASVVKSWTRANLGRRFWACENYDWATKRRQCDYFKWYDQEINAWTMDVCNELIDDKKALKDNVIRLEYELAELREWAIEVKRLKKPLKAMEGTNRVLVKCLVFVVVLVTLMLLLVVLV